MVLFSRLGLAGVRRGCYFRGFMRVGVIEEGFCRSFFFTLGGSFEV